MAVATLWLTLHRAANSAEPFKRPLWGTSSVTVSLSGVDFFGGS